VKTVREGSAPRTLALCGSSVNTWSQRSTGVLFSAFDQEWGLGVAADPGRCELRRLHEQTNVAADHPEVVERLRTAALQEIARRGLDSGLLDWLRNEGREPFPTTYRVTDAHPAPPGWHTYFGDLYHGE
jgi:hypothetical protein